MPKPTKKVAPVVPKPKKVNRKVTKPDVPMSETSVPKDPSPRSAQSCVEILRQMAKENPKRVISRNFFRIKSPITESVWNAHFGTFQEFKAQAGITLSRQQHNHEKRIAKHASVDHYRALSTEREEWGEKYLRPSGKRFQLGIFASDLHDIEIDPFFLRVFLDTVKRSNPDLVCFVGDVLDLPEFGKYAVDPRDWDPVKRIRFAREEIFAPTRKAAPHAQIDMIEGNHEYRILRHMADATPALKTVLSDLHGMTMQKFFGLDDLEINWVGKADLAAYTEKDVQDELRNNYRIYWDCFLAHHFPQGRDMGLPGVNGHHHKHQVWPMFNMVYGAYEWHQMGSGHRRSASYCEGEKWHNGFVIAHVDTETRSVNHEYIQVTDIASVGGRLYVREESERINRSVILLPKGKT